MGRPTILYISYDGMLEPLGQSQVIAYLEHLSGDAAIHLLSFEKPADLAIAARRTAIGDRLAEAGIAWHPLTYHKRPTTPATLFDMAQGIFVALRIALRHRVRIVHARSYVAALVGLAVKRLTGAKLLFDMRGLWADERADAFAWPKDGALYRTVKRIERHLLLGSDHIVTLTRASKPVIEAFPCFSGSVRPPVAVIPTCADLDRFAPAAAARPSPFTLGYVGTIGAARMFDEVLSCFRVLRKQRPDARLLVVNRGETARIWEMTATAGIPETALEVTSANHDEMPALVRRMSAGTAINRPTFSEVARAPTRLAEFLGCGVPCLGNAGIGDMEEILDGEAVGVVMRDFTDAERHRAVDRLLALDADPSISARCRATAEARFSLDQGVAAYRAIYRELLG